ncbi:hypothetical protein BV25DRAFT_1829043 [Artomyces pyxidatus]|uniref:Uncharacterized protein n=1 Tax=Artomyces pyxidatus TaxID=48021 RepID=A0ACB8SUI0_9AGAM|nr:hypothetical protein BV25DRAFT_1829043 [Artomyces pyxidatus]
MHPVLLQRAQRVFSGFTTAGGRAILPRRRHPPVSITLPCPVTRRREVHLPGPDAQTRLFMPPSPAVSGPRSSLPRRYSTSASVHTAAARGFRTSMNPSLRFPAYTYIIASTNAVDATSSPRAAREECINAHLRGRPVTALLSREQWCTLQQPDSLVLGQGGLDRSLLSCLLASGQSTYDLREPRRRPVRHAHSAPYLPPGHSPALLSR